MTQEIHIPDRIGKTTVGRAQPKTLITRGSGFVDRYDGVINPFIGCSFGCTYCYASNFASSETMQKEWGSWVTAKTNIYQQIDKLPKGSLNGKTIYMATATDPYQPLERQALATRVVMESLVDNQPRVKMVIQTRSPLVERDIDLLQELVQAGGRLQINMTVTTDDEKVRKDFEPGCPSNPARLKSVASLTRQGVQTCITMTPLLPLRNAAAFGQQLLDTGCRRFIIQDFHAPAKPGVRFVRGTDARAPEHLERHYGLEHTEALKAYRQEYFASKATLARMLPQLGVGKPGFAPPF